MRQRPGILRAARMPRWPDGPMARWPDGPMRRCPTARCLESELRLDEADDGGRDAFGRGRTARGVVAYAREVGFDLDARKARGVPFGAVSAIEVRIGTGRRHRRAGDGWLRRAQQPAEALRSSKQFGEGEARDWQREPQTALGCERSAIELRVGQVERGRRQQVAELEDRKSVV